MVPPSRKSETGDLLVDARTWGRKKLVKRLKRFFLAVDQTLQAQRRKTIHRAERVHRLRVSCRRTDSVWELFRPLLKRKSEKIRNCVKRVRRAAGPVRDLDIVLGNLEPRAIDPATKKLICQRINVRHQKASGRLIKALEDVSRPACRRELLRIARSEWKPSSISLQDYARNRLQAIRKPLWKGLHQKKLGWPEWHQLRIQGKSLRYALETFQELLPKTDVQNRPHHSSQRKPSSKRLTRQVADPVKALSLERLEQLQQHLGKVNDHITAQAFWQTMLCHQTADRLAAVLAEQVVVEHRLASQALSEFQDWWATQRIR